MKKHLTSLTISALLVIGTTVAALAQAGPTGGGPQPGGPGSPATITPLDGGASLLLAAGAAYGIRKLRQRRKAA